MNTSNATTPSIQVRLAEADDAESITSIINSAFRTAEGFFVERDRIDVGSVLNFLNSGEFLLAESDGLLLGCVYVQPQAAYDARPTDRAYLGLLSVAPTRQHSGLGTLLMDAAEDYCRALGAKFMDIKVVNLRTELPAYYHRRGYVETGTSPFPTDIPTKQLCHFIEMSKPLQIPTP